MTELRTPARPRTLSWDVVQLRLHGSQSLKPRLPQRKPQMTAKTQGRRIDGSSDSASLTQVPAEFAIKSFQSQIRCGCNGRGPP